MDTLMLLEVVTITAMAMEILKLLKEKCMRQ